MGAMGFIAMADITPRIAKEGLGNWKQYSLQDILDGKRNYIERLAIKKTVMWIVKEGEFSLYLEFLTLFGRIFVEEQRSHCCFDV